MNAIPILDKFQLMLKCLVMNLITFLETWRIINTSMSKPGKFSRQWNRRGETMLLLATNKGNLFARPGYSVG